MINTRNAGLLLGLGVLGTLSASSAKAQVLISQVYGGGGNSGATITNDFVELFNSSTSAFNLAGTSLQYASAAGTFNGKLDLVGTVQPGRFFLVKLAPGAGGTSFSVTPDQDGSGAGALALSATAGKVAFANITTLLGSATAANGANIIDFVGYGATASTFEGAGPALGMSNTTSVTRVPGAVTLFLDTNNNSTDFIGTSPTLRNSAVPAPSSVAVMALGGLMPMIAIARRRRAAK